MGVFAPGKLKSRRGWQSSPRRLLYRFSFLDPGDSRTHCGKDSISSTRLAIFFIAIVSRRLGPLWSAKLAHSFTAADSRYLGQLERRIKKRLYSRPSGSQFGN